MKVWTGPLPPLGVTEITEGAVLIAANVAVTVRRSTGHFNRIFDLNVKGLLFASQMSVPNAAVYSAIKAAVESFTRTLAAELGPRKILVNSILPGPVETEGRHALNDFDAMSANLILGRPGAHRTTKRHRERRVIPGVRSGGWITGQVIPVAGGLH